VKTMVVIPTYNEVFNLSELVARILKLEVVTLEILIVDDGSPDGTPELAEKLAVANSPRSIHLLKRLKKHGLGPAYVAGFREALKLGADQIIQMDADLAHSPEYIPKFLKYLQDYDVVVGSRYIPGAQTDKRWPKRRRLLSNCGNFYMRMISGVRLRDPRSGFKAFRREVLETVCLETLQSKGFVFQTELASRCQRLGYKVIETPIIFHDRKAGRSKMSLQIIIEALWRSFLVR
jgi:dolichol-phosphate mannosyltransferase